VQNQHIPKTQAGKLATPITMKNYAVCAMCPAGAFKHADAELLFVCFISWHSFSFSGASRQTPLHTNAWPPQFFRF